VSGSLDIRVITIRQSAELVPVVAAVQPMSGHLAGSGFDRGDAAEPGEAGFG
jgi:hypothetical protein